MFSNYILLTILLQLSQFLPFPLSTSTTHSLRPSPHHCSCPWVMHIRSLATPFPIYFTSPWLFHNYLFVLLNPLTSSPTPQHSPPNGQPKNALCIHDSVSVLLVCLVYSVDSIVDRYVCIYCHFIVHKMNNKVFILFFFLNKSL